MFYPATTGRWSSWEVSWFWRFTTFLADKRFKKWGAMRIFGSSFSWGRVKKHGLVWKKIVDVWHFLGGGNPNIFYFHPENWGRFPIWRAYFSNGLKPPTSFECLSWFECWDCFLRNRKHVDFCFLQKPSISKVRMVCSHRRGFVLSLSSWWDIIKALITRFASDTEFDISKDELECALMRRLDQKGQHL